MFVFTLGLDQKVCKLLPHMEIPGVSLRGSGVQIPFFQDLWFLKPKVLRIPGCHDSVLRPPFPLLSSPLSSRPQASGSTTPHPRAQVPSPPSPALLCLCALYFVPVFLGTFPLSPLAVQTLCLLSSDA